MNQFYRALHMPPKRLLRKVMGEKEIYTIAVRPRPTAEGTEPLPALEGGLHIADQCLPLLGAHGAVQRAVGHDFNRVVGQQQVDEGTVIVLRVPDMEFGELRERTLAGRGIVPDIAPGQAGLDADADLAGVAQLAFGDQLLQLLKHGGGKSLAQMQLGPAVAHQTCKALKDIAHLTNPPRRHRHQSCRRHRS